jgi:thiol-disulfide isomerase/thioredoxin
MRTLLILAMLCPLLSAGQQPNKITPLTIGDTLPDMALSSIINYKTQSASLSSFKGRLLILDFWATWCTSCLKHFPKMDSLQQQYAGQVQVLLVNSKNTGDNEKKIQAFFEKRKMPNGSPYTLPSVMADTLLTQLFPHKLKPHYVWLDSSRKVVAITDAAELTAKNIAAFLNGGSPALRLKKDVLSYNPAAPLLANGNGGNDSNLLFNSTFSRFIPGLPSGVNYTTTATTWQVTILNLPVLSLYQQALRFPANRVLLHVKNRAAFNPASVTPTNSFCYQLTLPAATPPAQRAALMAQDLNRLLGLQGSIQTRTLPCWVLVRGQKPGQSPTASLPPAGAETVQLNNQPLSALLAALNGSAITFPPRRIVIDETGYTNTFSLQLTLSQNRNELNRQLATYGLRLVPAQRALPVFILADAAPNGHQYLSTFINNENQQKHRAITEKRK